MQRFTDSLRNSAKHRDWYVALTSALTLPDICGRIQFPGVGSQKRYEDWFNQWLAYRFKARIGADMIEHVFLSGSDLYALRCALLHQGDVNIASQKAQKQRNALDSFIFVAPPPGQKIHLNQLGRSLQIQVNIFCNDVADAVDRWYANSMADPRIVQEVKNLMVVLELDEGGLTF